VCEWVASHRWRAGHDLRTGGRGVEAAGSASNDGDAWRRFGAAERSACGVAQHRTSSMRDARRWSRALRLWLLLLAAGAAHACPLGF
jgi:hypothetical protein